MNAFHWTSRRCRKAFEEEEAEEEEEQRVGEKVWRRMDGKMEERRWT